MLASDSELEELGTQLCHGSDLACELLAPHEFLLGVQSPLDKLADIGEWHDLLGLQHVLLGEN